jgi:hypothetical protein
MTLRQVWAAIIAFIGCAPAFTATNVNGVPNLDQYAPDMWRMGQPADATAWSYVDSVIGKPGKPVLVVKLNDDGEGDDSPMLGFQDWHLDKEAMPPEDNKPWTIFVKPDPKQVSLVVNTVIAAHQAGWVVVHHCTAGRDRTSLIAALVQQKMFGWTKQQVLDDMLKHGYRWELPDLDAYLIENVRAKPLPISKLN